MRLRTKTDQQMRGFWTCSDDFRATHRTVPPVWMAKNDPPKSLQLINHTSPEASLQTCWPSRNFASLTMFDGFPVTLNQPELWGIRVFWDHPSDLFQALTSVQMEIFLSWAGQKIPVHSALTVPYGHGPTTLYQNHTFPLFEQISQLWLWNFLYQTRPTCSFRASETFICSLDLKAHNCKSTFTAWTEFTISNIKF